MSASVAAGGTAPESPVEIISQAPHTRNVIDLENKIMQVGDLRYYIDMIESETSRFFRIAVPRTKRSRIVVPMNIAEEFCSRMEEVDNAAKSYESSKSSETRKDGTVFSVSLIVPGRRRYYFDLVESEGFLDLKISYLYNNYKDTVRFVTDAVGELLNIIKSFIEKYPPLPGQLTEDNAFPKFRNQNNRRFYNNQQRPRRQMNGLQSNDGAPRRPNQQLAPLVVLPEPTPETVNTGSNKEYSFELVKGTNAFLRITEIVNGNRKATMHIPTDACEQFREVFEKFASFKIDETPESAVVTGE